MVPAIIRLLTALLLVQSLVNSAEHKTNVRLQENPAQYSAQDISQLQTQAKGGDSVAQLKLARAYAQGNGVPASDEMAAEWFRKAAEQGNAEAQDSLGAILLVGQGVERDKQQAVAWFKKSARQGNAGAMFHLGAAYYNGDGVDVDDSLSYAWFTLAKEAGNPKAVEAVQRAESELKPLVITRGFKKIAEMYEKGGYLPENQTEAARWWLKAATKGDEDAQVAIALKFINGQGVAQDFDQGRNWCNQAAKERSGPGAYCLGYMAQHGMGAASNPKEARRWYEQAAQSGHHRAMKALAQMEAAGEGGKADRPAACLLYARLAAAGDQDALRSLAKLKKEIDAKQWQKLERQMSTMRIDPYKLDLALKQIETQ